MAETKTVADDFHAEFSNSFPTIKPENIEMESLKFAAFFAIDQLINELEELANDYQIRTGVKPVKALALLKTIKASGYKV